MVRALNAWREGTNDQKRLRQVANLQLPKHVEAHDLNRLRTSHVTNLLRLTNSLSPGPGVEGGDRPDDARLDCPGLSGHSKLLSIYRKLLEIHSKLLVIHSLRQVSKGVIGRMMHASIAPAFLAWRAAVAPLFFFLFITLKPRVG